MDKLLIATGHGRPGLFHDEAHLPEAFAKHDIAVEARDWKTIEPDGTPVVVRTAWDYTQHPERFGAWLDKLETTGTPCINSPAIMRWNLDKRYLLELQAKGHDIVPTRVVDDYSPQAVQDITAAEGWLDAVAKPVIGGGAEGLVRFGPDGPVTLGVTGNWWAADASPVPVGACLVQPFMSEIQAGEWSVFFYGGEYSHAILKTPGAGDFRVQEEHGGTTQGAEAPQHVLDAAAAIAQESRAAVARVDGLDVEGQFLLMELELIEPELYFRYATGAEARFAAAVTTELHRTTRA